MAATELLVRNVVKSGLLSRSQIPASIPLLDVIRELNEAKVSFVLVGAHGMASWRGKPRATQDVDVVVATKHMKKAVRVLTAAFPELEAVDLPAVTRLRNRDTHDVFIDVMKTVQQPYRETFRNTFRLSIEGQEVRVPSLEMAIVMKFSAMTSVQRALADKYQDAHDLMCLVLHNPNWNQDKLAKLAALIYPDGGKEIREKVRIIAAGEKLVL